MRKGSARHRKPSYQTGSVKSLDELIGLARSTASIRLKQSIFPPSLSAGSDEQKSRRVQWEEFLKSALGDEAIKLGSRLLNQQLWLWGRDVPAQGENLLLRYGFLRHGIPQGRMGCSCYSLSTRNGGSIGLWGFGIFFGKPEFGGIYLRRYEFLPRRAKSHRLEKIGWCEQDLMEFQIPDGICEQESTFTLLAECCGWIASYEEWVAKTLGTEYRREGLDQWTSPVCKADEIPDLWREMERLCRGNIRAGQNDSNGISSD